MSAEESTSLEHTVVTHSAGLEKGTGKEKQRVLIVDDDPVVRRIVLELLNNRYTIISASTGVQIPDLLKKHKPDLVILDVMLPWINGFELCRMIKTHSQNTELPVLFLTSCKEKEDLMTGKEVGASGYLTKPFHAKDLYKEVERLLAA